MSEFDGIFGCYLTFYLLLGSRIFSGRERREDEIDLIWSREVGMESRDLCEDRVGKVEKSIVPNIVPDILYQL